MDSERASLITNSSSSSEKRRVINLGADSISEFNFKKDVVSDTNSFLDKYKTTKDWDTFKKEYYLLETKIKQSLENLLRIQQTFSRQTAQIENKANFIDLESNNSNTNNNDNIKTLLTDYQNTSEEAKEFLFKMSNLLTEVKIGDKEPQALTKSSMLQRFKEILLDHETEYKKSMSSMDSNRKKYELFKEAKRVGGSKIDFSSKTKNLVRENQILDNNVNLSDEIVSHAKIVSRNHSVQKQKMDAISKKADMLKNSLPSLDTIITQIRRAKLKRELVISFVIAVCTLITLYNIFR